MKNKHHKTYKGNIKKGRLQLPKKTLPGTPDIDTMMAKDMEKESMAPLIHMRGRRWIHIENYTGIADYKENKIKIMGKQQMITIQGRGLSIIYFTEDDVLIGGMIQSIDFME